MQWKKKRGALRGKFFGVCKIAFETIYNILPTRQEGGVVCLKMCFAHSSLLKSKNSTHEGWVVCRHTTRGENHRRSMCALLCNLEFNEHLEFQSSFSDDVEKCFASVADDNTHTKLAAVDDKHRKKSLMQNQIPFNWICCRVSVLCNLIRLCNVKCVYREITQETRVDTNKDNCLAETRLCIYITRASFWQHCRYSDSIYVRDGACGCCGMPCASFVTMLPGSELPWKNHLSSALRDDELSQCCRESGNSLSFQLKIPVSHFNFSPLTYISC